MRNYVLKRLVLVLPTLALISTLGFFAVRSLPGRPLALRPSSSELGLQYQESLVASETPLKSYLVWIRRLLRFDWGESIYYEEPVLRVIGDRLPISLLLGLLSGLTTYAVCIPLGVLKALRHGSRIDAVTTGVLTFLQAVPPFALGILLIGLAGRWFPLGGIRSDSFASLSSAGRFFDLAHHLFLPVTAAVASNLAMLTQLTKNSLLDELSQPYVLAGHARGLSRKRTVLHALRGASLPVFTHVGHSISLLLSGNLMVETVFSIPGIGRLTYDSILRRDYPVIVTLLLLFSLANVVGTLVGDLLSAWADPRVDLVGRPTC